MKRFALLLIFIFCQTFVFGQAKVDEFEFTDSDTESVRIWGFLVEVKERPQNKGLIVIYAGENRERLGSIVAVTDGIKSYIERYSLKDKVSVVITQGKKFLYQEMWMIPEGAEYPEIKAFNFDFSDLKTKYFYATHCLDCEPAVHELAYDAINLEHYANVLKKNKDYQGVIDIYLNNDGYAKQDTPLSSARKYAGDFRRILTKDFGLKNKRITIRIKKSAGERSLATANLYIVPKAFKNKN